MFGLRSLFCCKSIDNLDCVDLCWQGSWSDNVLTKYSCITSTTKFAVHHSEHPNLFICKICVLAGAALSLPRHNLQLFKFLNLFSYSVAQRFITFFSHCVTMKFSQLAANLINAHNKKPKQDIRDNFICADLVGHNNDTEIIWRTFLQK